MIDVGLVGFGEAAQAFVSGWRADEISRRALGDVAAFDVKVEDLVSRSSLQECCNDLEVRCAEIPAEALAARQVVFSLVTADKALRAATRAAPNLSKGALFLDCNSCSPNTKSKAAAVVEGAGGIYVDVAVMAPVHPARHRTVLLLSGAGAEEALAIVSKLNMNAKIAGDTVGQASSIKMLRSVMIKGFEALTAECFLAARRAGVEAAVLASLQSSDPGLDWTKRAAYNLERMMVHGQRRAAEMIEVAATLRELGLPDRMATATAEWQRQIGGKGTRSVSDTLEARADAILGSTLD
ncbi:NAD(P)-dependent oxidoreductase (plasmid) [Agrobacterium tumefaciens]|uniref:NAD(P)-dependent oxidoreductase n=1 Tax=Agrobacterium tumefaciens TaxID=358 RepID=A0AAP9J9P5_AGRTU|nr:DUF1932 domain-containing protein [Agrobacterium tumefaciens]NSZ60116.1 NAD(P)-dependent oxidoreductase [Agrobacterium tumefaciens]QDY97801.1 NAD(P)-dependent oxidoreductase [Agrobacterium tumefaciens]UXS12836.1 NAD(P)-dependent oxidoreductase [Agrobacterium tumefaciens]UXS20198.1 NAD(P)-dependent oxidoreductase [Agrobacterium tumefaciens]UXS27939.1 NAD(P)-dependent oxidoreductase [Agrobacterium tumefaciens]